MPGKWFTYMAFISIIIFSGCDIPDGSPPEVVLTYAPANNVVFEIQTITTEITDDDTVAFAQLYIDNEEYGDPDTLEPFEFTWNTLPYPDASEHTIQVRAFDAATNMGESEILTVTVDNSLAYPQSIDSLFLEARDGGILLTWEVSSDADFDFYTLNRSLNTDMTNSETIFSSDDVTATVYFDFTVNLLEYHYYQMTVTDTLGLSGSGNIVSSSLDAVPDPIDMDTAFYDLDAMTLQWQASTISDFAHYRILRSLGESGPKDPVSEILLDIDTTEYLITNFDPTLENWYWLMVTDTLGQSSVGAGATHPLEIPPDAVTLFAPQKVGDNYEFTWSKSRVEDFRYYTLWSYDSQTGDSTDQYTSFGVDDTVVNATIAPGSTVEFKVSVVDIWDLSALSNIQVLDLTSYAVAFGGSEEDAAMSILLDDALQVHLAGYSSSFGSGSRNPYILHADLSGAETGSFISSLPNDAEVGDFIQQNDQSFVYAGYLDLGSHKDAWVQMISADGAILDSKTAGWDDGRDEFNAIVQSLDGSFYVAGITDHSHSSLNGWIQKLDGDLDLQWGDGLILGETGQDELHDIAVLSSGDIVSCGFSDSYGDGSRDMWVVRTAGNTLTWNHVYGGAGDDAAFSIIETSDGSLLVAGSIRSSASSDMDGVLLMLDGSGNTLWETTMGGSGDEVLHAVIETEDGSYTACGYTDSDSEGGFDGFMVSVSSSGEVLWTETIGGSDDDVFHDLKQIPGSGYLLTGYTRSIGSGDKDIWLVRTDEAGFTVGMSD